MALGPPVCCFMLQNYSDHVFAVWHIQISNQKPPTGREALAYRRQAGDTTAVGVRSAPPERGYRSSSRSNYQTSTKPYVITANSPPMPYKKKFWHYWLSIICWLWLVWLWCHICTYWMLSGTVFTYAVEVKIGNKQYCFHWCVPNFCTPFSFCTCRTKICAVSDNLHVSVSSFLCDLWNW